MGPMPNWLIFTNVQGNRAHVHCNVAKWLIMPNGLIAQYRIWMMKRGWERGTSVRFDDTYTSKE